jgi:hypothetical protein
VPSLWNGVGVLSGRVSNPVIVLLALGLALGGCGSGDPTPNPAAPPGSDPVAWVGAFCGGLGDVIAGASAVTTSQPSLQGQKDGLLEFSDIAQRAFTNTARQLTELGPPRITDGKGVQTAAVGFFTTAALTVSGQRDKLTALDENDPEFMQKINDLAGLDLGAVSTPMQELTNNKELAPAFGAARECQRLGVTAGHR